jgi:hypothetical protein
LLLSGRHPYSPLNVPLELTNGKMWSKQKKMLNGFFPKKYGMITLANDMVWKRIFPGARLGSRKDIITKTIENGFRYVFIKKINFTNLIYKLVKFINSSSTIELDLNI